MPIVKTKDGVCVKYRMPSDIKNIVTDDFLKEFRNQLFRIHKYYSLEVFAEEGIPINTSTSGWFAALGKACMITDKMALFDYYRTLPWYEADIFDGELADMLVERHFILGDLSKIIEKQLGIKESDLRVCNDCGRMYTDEMVVEIKDTDMKELVSKYRCLCCNDAKEAEKDGNSSAGYYQQVLCDLNEYTETHPVKVKEDEYAQPANKRKKWHHMAGNLATGCCEELTHDCKKDCGTCPCMDCDKRFDCDGGNPLTGCDG